MKPVVIAGYKRSPFQFAHKGQLVKKRPDDPFAYMALLLRDRSDSRNFIGTVALSHRKSVSPKQHVLIRG